MTTHKNLFTSNSSFDVKFIEENWYKVELGRSIWKELVEWIDDNVQGYWRSHYSTPNILHFSDETDYVAYKLVWE